MHDWAMPEEHELRQFMTQDLAELRAEYDRIHDRAGEDPGTAGDEGEAGWAALLKAWLPASYHVVTKGRVLAADGAASPQIDVLVLSPNYPKRLLDKKLYLSGGVLAVFECKLTLDKAGLASAMRRVASFREVTRKFVETPRDVVLGPLFYGVLAHSHVWSDQTAIERLDDLIESLESREHPLHVPDLVCVGPLATWRKVVILSPAGPRPMFGASQGRSVSEVHATMMRDAPGDRPGDLPPATPIAHLLHSLLAHLAEFDSTLTPLVEYLGIAGTASRGTHGNVGVTYPYTVLPSHIGAELAARVTQRTDGYREFDPWSEIQHR